MEGEGAGGREGGIRRGLFTEKGVTSLVSGGERKSGERLKLNAAETKNDRVMTAPGFAGQWLRVSLGTWTVGEPGERNRVITHRPIAVLRAAIMVQRRRAITRFFSISAKRRRYGFRPPLRGHVVTPGGEARAPLVEIEPPANGIDVELDGFAPTGRLTKRRRSRAIPPRERAVILEHDQEGRIDRAYRARCVSLAFERG